MSECVIDSLIKNIGKEEANKYTVGQIDNMLLSEEKLLSIIERNRNASNFDNILKLATNFELLTQFTLIITKCTNIMMSGANNEEYQFIVPKLSDEQNSEICMYIKVLHTIIGDDIDDMTLSKIESYMMKDTVEESLELYKSNLDENNIGDIIILCVNNIALLSSVNRLSTDVQLQLSSIFNECTQK